MAYVSFRCGTQDNCLKPGPADDIQIGFESYNAIYKLGKTSLFALYFIPVVFHLPISFFQLLALRAIDTQLFKQAICNEVLKFIVIDGFLCSRIFFYFKIQFVDADEYQEYLSNHLYLRISECLLMGMIIFN